jgi:hypothetical protein
VGAVKYDQQHRGVQLFLRYSGTHTSNKGYGIYMYCYSVEEVM